MYSKNGKLVGGFTIRVLRDRMSKVEREFFEKEFIIKIN